MNDTGQSLAIILKDQERSIYISKYIEHFIIDGYIFVLFSISRRMWYIYDNLQCDTPKLFMIWMYARNVQKRTKRFKLNIYENGKKEKTREKGLTKGRKGELNV